MEKHFTTIMLLIANTRNSHICEGTTTSRKCQLMRVYWTDGQAEKMDVALARAGRYFGEWIVTGKLMIIYFHGKRTCLSFSLSFSIPPVL